MTNSRWPFIGEVAEEHLTKGVWLREAAATFCSGFNANVLELELLRLLHIGQLVAFGSPNYAGAEFAWIPTRHWFFLELDHKGPNVARGEGIVYFYVRVMDQTVLLKKEQQSSAELSEQYRTGAPGRPGSIHLIKVELERRLQSGELVQDGRIFKPIADDLASWLRTAHPPAAPITSKTIQNELGPMWRAIRKRN